MNFFKKYLFIFLLFSAVTVFFFFNVFFDKSTLLTYSPEMYPEKLVNQRFQRNSLQDGIAPAWIDVPYSAINHSFFMKLKLPLWNQYSAIGYPLAADMESSSFFPLHLPSILGLKFWDFYVIFRLITATVFLYLFLKEIKFKTISSILGAFLFSFSGYFIYYLNNFILNVDMLLPAGLFFTSRLLKKNSVLNFTLTLIALFLILNGGNPQSSLIGLIFINCYFLYFALTEKQSETKKKTKILNFLLIDLLITGLSAFNYLLFLELYRNAWTIHSNGIASIHMEKIGISNFVFPYLIGFLKGATFNNISSTRILPYFGILATWLVFVGIFSNKHRSIKRFSLVIFCFWFLKLFGFPFFEPILKLPFITNIWFNKYTSTLFFTASILAAIGADSLTDFFEKSRFDKIKKSLKTVYPLVSAVFLFIMLQIVANYLGLNTSVRDFLPRFIDNNYISNNVSNQKLIGSAFFKWERIFIILAIFLSVLVIIRPERKYRKRFTLFLSSVLFFSIIAETFLYLPKMRADKFKPEQKFPYVDFLQKDKDFFRIYGTGQTVMPQENLFFGISDIRIVSPLLYSRYADFFRELLINQSREDFHPYLGSQEVTLNNVSNNLLSLLNVKYVLTNDYFTANPIYELVYDNDLKIYLNKKFMPRVFLIDDIVQGVNQEQIFSYLKSDSFVPRKKAIVEGVTNDTVRKLNADHKENGSDSTAAVKQYDADYVNIGVSAGNSKLLILGDLYYPGWKAYIDGGEVKIYPVNYVMRGVFIPKGRHTVEFIYRPKSFLIGVTISLLTVCITISVIGIKMINPNHDKKRN